MKKLLVIPATILLMIVGFMAAFNCKQEPSTNNEGMTITKVENRDSTIIRGQHLVKTLGYGEKDLGAIFAYLKAVEGSK